MRRLVIETATPALSLALFDGGDCIAAFDAVIGRGHAERLIPEIAALPDGGRADEIWVDRGPGSFTGVRIGLAAARGLGLAWNARVRGFDSAPLIAASAIAAHPEIAAQGFAIAMEGGHGEYLVASVGKGGRVVDGLVSMTPEDAAAHDAAIVVGSRAEDVIAIRGTGRAFALLPSARAATGLAGDAIGDALSALYARAPDATPMHGADA